MSTVAKQILNFLRDRQDQMIERLGVLVKAESPSLTPATQRRVFEPLAEWLRDIGFRCRILPGGSSGGQLLAVDAQHRHGQPIQMLLGHADTVWPEGTLEHMPFVIEGGLIKGPGAYDMKAGLIQALFALQALRELDIAMPLAPVFFVTSDEELGSTDSEAALTGLAQRARRVFVLEPGTGAEGHLKTARKGIGQFRVDVQGKAAHAGVEPEAGASAIVEMARVILSLDRLNDPERGISVNVGTVVGGSRANVVAASSEAVVDVRVPTAADAREIEEAVLGLKSVDPDVILTISGGISRPPMERTPRNWVLWRQAREAAAQLGIDLEQSMTGGGSDGNLTSLHTATLDGIGAVGGGAHAPHEFVYADRMADRAALLALLLASDDEVE